MKQLRYQLSLPLLVAMLAFGLVTPVLAEGEATSSETGSTKREKWREFHSTHKHKSYSKHSQVGKDTSSEKKRMLFEDRAAKIEKRLEERKVAFETRLQKLKESRKAKLEGRKLERCENREERINGLIDKSVEVSKLRLAVFQKIEERVKEFYTNKSLVAEGYASAVAMTNEKEAAAVAAIEVMASENFSCDQADGERPGAIIREVVHNRNNALKEYKTSIKDLIRIVKQALSNEKNTEEVKSENESEAVN